MDYEIIQQWKVGVNASMGQILSVTVDDTKVIDGAPSNIVCTDSFLGIASSYTAIEVKKGIEENYIRPYAVTSNC